MMLIRSQTLRGWLADLLMLPLMYIVQGTIFEHPQRTHRWNNVKLIRAEAEGLRHGPLISCPGMPRSTRRFLGFIPMFHLPLFGGWRSFVVLSPLDHTGPWHVGWLTSDVGGGYSMVPQRGPVRVLLGPEPVEFFGLTTDGYQIPLVRIGQGEIGAAGRFAHMPLR